jgi:L-cysteine S-thiosulfotransferase
VTLIKPIALLAAVALAAPAFAQTPPKVDAARVADVIKGTFSKAPPDWVARATQDETQRICSETKNQPSSADFDKIKQREVASIVFPPDGNVIGDWKKGVQVAQNGRGGQFSDAPDTVNGGNCYACHQMDRAEVSYGTLGPSLLEYGKIRKFEASEARQVYAKIYNAQSVQPCSNMPRFGYHKFLTIDQIKDVTAYLMSPDSPVNK